MLAAQPLPRYFYHIFYILHSLPHIYALIVHWLQRVGAFSYGTHKKGGSTQDEAALMRLDASVRLADGHTLGNVK